MFKKKLAFTLSEIMIAMTVIGVIATLIFPGLVRGQKTTQARAQFDTAYASLAKSIVEMESAGHAVMPDGYPTAQSFYDVFINFNKVTSKDAANTTFTTNNGIKYTISKQSIEIDNGEGEPVTIEPLLIEVDINGENKHPNSSGWDIFKFQLTNDGIQPYGGKSTDKEVPQNAEAAEHCITADPDVCAYYAVAEDEYFKTLYNAR